MHSADFSGRPEHAPEAVTVSEEKYRTLFNSIEEGFCIIKMLFDEYGDAYDYYFLEVNPAFQKQTGFSDVIGKSIKELVPGIERYWFDRYGQVAKTGEPERFENESRRMGRYYDVSAFSIDDPDEHHVAVLFNDITERKRREANLAFLAEVSNDLVHLSDIDETMNTLGAKISAHFNLSACAFAEITDDELGVIEFEWHRSDMPNLTGTYSMKDFVSPDVLQACRKGEYVVICDVFADSRTDGNQYAALNIGAFLAIPLVRDHEWRFLLVVYRSKPYNWPPEEVELIRELNTRIWIRMERAKAEKELRESEDIFRSYVTVSSDIVYKMSPDWQMIIQLQGKDFLASTTIPLKLWIHDYIPDHERKKVNQAIKKAIRTKSLFELEHQVIDTNGKISWIFSRAVPRLDEQGEIVEWIGAGTNITLRKQAEEALRRAEKTYRLNLQKEVRERTTELNANKELLQTVFDTSPNSISVLQILNHPDGGVDEFEIVFFNAITFKTIGHRDVIGQRYTEAFPGVRGTGIMAQFIKTATTGKLSDFEHWYEGEGMRNWFRTIAVKQDDLLIVTTEDITERKTAELKLKHSNELLEAAANTSPLGMVLALSIRNAENKIIDFEYRWMNPVSQRLAGDNLAGKRMLELYPHVQHIGLFDAFVQTVEKNIQTDFEEHYVPTNRWFRWLAAKLNDGLFISVEEITGRKLAEEQIQEDAAMIRGIADSAPDMVYVIDIQKMQQVYSNYRIEQLVNKTQEDIRQMGETFFERTVHPDDRENYTANITKLRSDTANHTHELTFRMIDFKKNLHWIKTRRTVYKRDKAGTPTHVIGVSQDITGQLELRDRNRKLLLERRQLEKQQRQEIVEITLNTQEEERRRIGESLHNGLGQLLYGVKLSLGQLGRAASQSQKDNETYQQTDKLLAEAIKESRRISHELMPSLLQDFGLEAAINDICKQFSQTIVFKCYFNGMHQRLDNYLTMAIFRIVQELMLNVVKHASATHASLKLTLNRKLITIQVEDDGSGFDITQPGKDGIGLKALTSKVKILDGTLDVLSAPGQGSNIRVSLPNRRQ